MAQQGLGEGFLLVAEEQQSEGPGPEGDTQERCLPGHVSTQSSASEPTAGEVGIIQSVLLENFMCHARLGPVRFGPNLNFLVGGKGKTALLSALVIGLSGNSLGLSMRDFIKEGETFANISITLKNSGASAYKSSLFGESITVEQCISVDTDPLYKLKDQAGNVVSFAKEEFIEMLEYFRIRMDNPVVVLQEEMSRQLLLMRDDHDRYNFFLKVTKLEQMRQEHSDILDRKVRNEQMMEETKEKLERLTSHCSGMEKHCQTMVGLKGRLEELKREMAWALVQETERDIVEMTCNIIVGDQHTMTLKQELEASKAKLTEVEKKQRTIRENIQKSKEEVAALEAKCSEARKNAEKSDRAHIEAEAFFYSFQNELRKLETIAEELHNKIEDLKKSKEQAEVEKQNKLSRLTQKLKNIKDEEESSFQEIKHLHRIVEKDDEEHFRLKKEEAHIQQRLNEEQHQLDRLKDCKSEPLKRFGAHIPALVESIENAHRQGQFTFKPLGPLGTCIRVRDPEFVLAVESCLKGVLLSFLCDNPNDEQVLHGLMGKVYPVGVPHPQIIVSAFECELQDVTERAACHPEFPTVLTSLEIGHSVVANILIEMKAIESVLLVKSISVAHSLMRGQRHPKNCSKVFTTSGDEVYKGCYVSCEESRAALLSDAETELSNLEKEIENKTSQLAAYHQHLCSLENDIKKNRDSIENRYRYIRELRATEVDVSSEKKDVEDETERESILLSVLEKEAQQNNASINEVDEKMKIQKEKVENLRRVKIEDEQTLEELKFKCNQVSRFVQSCVEEQNHTALEVDPQQQSVLYCENVFTEHLISLQKKKEDLATKKRELQRETVLAEYVCPKRVEVTKTASLLNGEIEMVKQTIQSNNYTYGSQEVIRRQIQQLNGKCLELSNEEKNLNNILVTLDKMSCQKFIMYQKERRSLSLQCKFFFQSLTSQWSLFGEVQIDHGNKTLSLTLLPEEEKRDAFSSTEVFSGDIQPFSNFLFILSLWAITESPFRCLDSFDVHMNNDQRNIAMDMILRIAHSQQYSQFILIVPEFMISLPQNPLIEILQIPESESSEESLSLPEYIPEEED